MYRNVESPLTSEVWKFEESNEDTYDRQLQEVMGDYPLEKNNKENGGYESEETSVFEESEKSGEEDEDDQVRHQEQERIVLQLLNEAKGEEWDDFQLITSLYRKLKIDFKIPFISHPLFHSH